MNAPQVAPRFPKIESPFDRHENENDEYVVYDEWMVDPDWFKNQTIAVEKLDGTNCAVYIQNQEVMDVFTRMGQNAMNYVNPYPTSTNHARIVDAVRNSVTRGWMSYLGDGYHYGEVVGPKINGNKHGLDERLFVPFDWARENLSYNSWGEYGQDFDALNEWFRTGLFSLFHAKVHGTDLDSASVSNGAFCEGIMFTDREVPSAWSVETPPRANYFAKLRRDMFEWYTGERH